MVTDEIPRPDIVVPAAFGHAVFIVEKHVKAAEDLKAAMTALNDHAVDIDEDVMDEIGKEKWRHEVAASAIADALEIICACDRHPSSLSHILGPKEIASDGCKYCGAKIVIEGAKE